MAKGIDFKRKGFKQKFVGSTYDVFLKDTRKKNKGSTSITLFGKNISDVKKQAKKTFKPFMKITKVKKISDHFREVKK